ncbi:tyrosine-type recombinase/integrase [Nitrospirillum amazonense]|uniref:tyrosine-type recombinase/integrase n=1 Tax=Nitrospirillum amazonense TaxID=28077 RepID=UPI00241298FA|nr:tyrosine-type recombinase/integrase [Nitrospirillum amazonense]MDG3442879.1 tyrosine-type recombinase/integrase [Nitrospirillum amazonense]
MVLNDASTAEPRVEVGPDCLVIKSGLLDDLVLPGVHTLDQVVEIERLARAAVRNVASRYSPNTQRAYRGAWRRYRVWAESLGVQPLNADPRIVGLYLAKASEGLALPTLRVHLAAILLAHRLAGRSLDAKHALIADQLAGVAALQARRRVRQAAPLLPDLLRRLVAAQPNTPAGWRNALLLLLGFGAAARRSELVGLDIGDITLVPGRGLEVTIRGGKTKRGRVAAVWASGDSGFCPVAAFHRWRAWHAVADADAPLFIAIGKGSRPGGRLSDRTVARVVQATAEGIGAADPALIQWTQGVVAAQTLGRRYSAHSLRSGLATAAAEAETSLKKIMDQTGHRSSDVALRYVRHADRWKDNPTEKLFRDRARGG